MIYGTFNASIPSEFIPKDKYEFNPNSTYSHAKQDGTETAINVLSGEWVLKSTGESIGHEGTIEFEVSE